MNNTPYAGFWKRALAFIIDTFIVSIPPLVLFGPIFIFLVFSMANSAESDGAAALFLVAVALFLLLQVFAIICSWLYFALLESGKHQATWGKRWLGVKVVGKDGQRITFARATGRFFSKNFLSSIFYFGFCMMPATNGKRALHDFIAKTYVVQADFQKGDDLPATPFRPLMLVGIFTALIAFFAFSTFLSNKVQQEQLKNYAKEAAGNLQKSSLQGKGILPENTYIISYFKQGDFLGARFGLSVDDTYTLLLREGSTQACCTSENPTEDCTHATGFPACK